MNCDGVLVRMPGRPPRRERRRRGFYRRCRPDDIGLIRRLSWRMLSSARVVNLVKGAVVALPVIESTGLARPFIETSFNNRIGISPPRRHDGATLARGFVAGAHHLLWAISLISNGRRQSRDCQALPSLTIRSVLQAYSVNKEPGSSIALMHRRSRLFVGEPRNTFCWGLMIRYRQLLRIHPIPLPRRHSASAFALKRLW